jgi:hypothetical protein
LGEVLGRAGGVKVGMGVAVAGSPVGVKVGIGVTVGRLLMTAWVAVAAISASPSRLKEGWLAGPARTVDSTTTTGCRTAVGIGVAVGGRMVGADVGPFRLMAPALALQAARRSALTINISLGHQDSGRLRAVFDER